MTNGKWVKERIQILTAKDAEVREGKVKKGIKTSL